MNTFAPYLQPVHEKRNLVAPMRRSEATARTYDWLKLETFENGQKREFYVDLSHPVKNLTAVFSESVEDGLQKFRSFFYKLFNRSVTRPDFRP